MRLVPINDDKTLDVIVDDYLAWLASCRPDLDWSRVAIVELPNDRRRAFVTVEEALSVDAFAPRFNEIRAMGTRDWMNLGMTQILPDGTLILALEYEPEPWGGIRFHARGRELQRPASARLQGSFRRDLNRDEHGSQSARSAARYAWPHSRILHVIAEKRLACSDR